MKTGLGLLLVLAMTALCSIAQAADAKKLGVSLSEAVTCPTSEAWVTYRKFNGGYFLNEVEPRGVAGKEGLKCGDFLYAASGKEGKFNLLAMTIASIYEGLGPGTMLQFIRRADQGHVDCLIGSDLQQTAQCTTRTKVQ